MISFSYNLVPLFEAFPAFKLMPKTAAECAGIAIEAILSQGTDPECLFAFLRTEAGLIALADLVFDGLDPGRAIGRL